MSWLEHNEPVSKFRVEVASSSTNFWVYNQKDGYRYVLFPDSNKIRYMKFPINSNDGVTLWGMDSNGWHQGPY